MTTFNDYQHTRTELGEESIKAEINIEDEMRGEVLKAIIKKKNVMPWRAILSCSTNLF